MIPPIGKTGHRNSCLAGAGPSGILRADDRTRLRCALPDEFHPQVIIEAKITEDDGTARDKVTRIQHLGQMSLPPNPGTAPRFEVIACIAGRGFGVRREDMKKMLLATRGLRG